MNALQQARKAIFGETWQLPVAVALLLLTACVARAVAPALWGDAGGPLLLAAVVFVFVTLTRAPTTS